MERAMWNLKTEALAWRLMSYMYVIPKFGLVWFWVSVGRYWKNGATEDARLENASRKHGKKRLQKDKCYFIRCCSMINWWNYFEFLEPLTLLFLELLPNVRSSHAEIQQLSVVTRAEKKIFWSTLSRDDLLKESFPLLWRTILGWKK